MPAIDAIFDARGPARQFRAVVSTLGGRSQDGVRPDFDGNRNVVDAARGAGVRRFVMVSYLGARQDHGVPEDNPFVGRAGALPAIYSYGHRDQHGLTVHPETGQAFTVEHGPNGGDEANLIEPGGNYGWPDFSFGRNYDGSDLTELPFGPGTQEPLVVWLPSIAPSGLMFYTGDQFPAWKGNLFIGSARWGEINNTGSLQRVVFGENFGELRREALLSQLHMSDQLLYRPARGVERAKEPHGFLDGQALGKLRLLKLDAQARPEGRCITIPAHAEELDVAAVTADDRPGDGQAQTHPAGLLAEELDFAPVRAPQPLEHLDGGGLPRTIRPEQPETFTPANLEIHRFNGNGAAEALVQTVYRNRRHAGFLKARCPPPRTSTAPI